MVINSWKCKKYLLRCMNFLLMPHMWYMGGFWYNSSIIAEIYKKSTFALNTWNCIRPRAVPPRSWCCPAAQSCWWRACLHRPPPPRPRAVEGLHHRHGQDPQEHHPHCCLHRGPLERPITKNEKYISQILSGIWMRIMIHQNNTFLAITDPDTLVGGMDLHLNLATDPY